MYSIMLKVKILLLSSLFLISCKISERYITKDNNKTKIAFIGNSITYGLGIRNRKSNSFPGIIQDSLKSSFLIGNFGVCSSTMLKKGFRSYRFTKKFKKALSFNADIIFIKLGTNDANPVNWRYKANFEKDYQEFFETLKKSDNNPRIILLSPVAYYKKTYCNKPELVRDTVCPIIRKIATNNGLDFIDLQTPTLNHPELFWDGVHPNKKGAELIATVILTYLNNNKILH
jgi:lysophospholipase L1-like esterase